jgi:hypothetical protein
VAVVPAELLAMAGRAAVAVQIMEHTQAARVILRLLHQVKAITAAQTMVIQEVVAVEPVQWVAQAEPVTHREVSAASVVKAAYQALPHTMPVVAVDQVPVVPLVALMVWADWAAAVMQAKRPVVWQDLPAHQTPAAVAVQQVLHQQPTAEMAGPA